jgi:antitoxin ParD1/3/4
VVIITTPIIRSFLAEIISRLRDEAKSSDARTPIGNCCQSRYNAHMPTRNVNISAQQAEFIRKSIGAGGFRNVSEVVRAGLRLLEQEESQNKLKLKHLRSLVKEGFDAIDRGDYESITQDNLGQFLDGLRTTKRGRKTA